jgi:hypothetical protein
MDAQQAERFVTSCQEALQMWERAQVLVADSAALCEATLAPQSRSEELRLQPPPCRGRDRHARPRSVARTAAPALVGAVGVVAP